MSDVLGREAAMVDSHISQVTYTGGIIGMFSDRRRKLELHIQRENEDGWRLRHVLPPKNTLFQTMLQAVCLIVTVMLWAPEPGETLIFEQLG